MNNFNDWAISKTINNNWINHKYHLFLKQSNQEEYLRSQIPFFYAVQAFPRFLSKLASLIENSEDRFLVIENLWEEHGQGKVSKFHTNTFKQFLNSLGWDGTLIQNPWVKQWVNKVLNKNLSASEYAAYLSGIEYAYAPISKTISEHLKTLQLHCEQSHYLTHSELDWVHGWELLQVAINLDNNEELIKSSFENGQNDFLDLYNHLIIATNSEMQEVHNQGISFYYTREDCNPELVQINKLCNSNEENNILMIASGGESIISILSLDNCLNIDAVDMNINQIDLCKRKINYLLDGQNLSNIEDAYIGKFEQVFLKIRQQFDYNGPLLLSEFISSSNEAREKLKFIVNELFSNKNLSYVFSDRATKYSSDSFAEHFYNIFIKACCDKNEITSNNIKNIIDGIDLKISKEVMNNLRLNSSKHQLQFIHGDFESLEVNKKYKVISVSNIGDWMSVEEYKEVLTFVKSRLVSGGSVICRKLLGDYDLKVLLEDCGFATIKEDDMTHFYSEVYVGIKI